MDIKKEEQDDYDPYVLRVRGLPWSASKDDIVKFFDGCTLRNGPNGIHLTMSREGRPSGEAYVEFETPEGATKGLEKNNEHLGSRYIEVFRSKENEMEWALRRCGLDGEEAFGDACVRLRGLPFGCSKEEIAQFFTGLEIVRNGITLPTDFQGRSTGEAYVQFSSQEIAEKAMGKHKEKIGHRYIEIFKSSLQEIRTAMGMGPVRMGRSMGSNRVSPYDRSERPGPFGRGGRRGPASAPDFGDRGGFPERVRDTGHNIHLRGLPFRAVERDIFDFFTPLKPVAVRIKYESSGRSSGEADAMFATHQEAIRAMKKDKEKIQHRYIELFLQSEPDPFRQDSMGPPYGGPSGPSQFRGGNGRSFMSEEDTGFGSPGMGPDRGFGATGGSGRGFGGEAERGFDAGYGGGSPGTAPSRGFGAGDREYGFGGEKPFAPAGDRGFGGSGAGAPAADRSFGGNSVDRGFGRGAADRGFGNGSSDRGFGAGAGGPPGRAAAYGGPERFGTADRRMDDRSYSGMGDGFRNGMQGSSMGAGNMRSDSGYGNDRTNESEFYGSGKLFGDNSYQSSPGQMMGPTTYPGY